MREKRHTSFGGRADQAADSPVVAKPTRTPAAERQWKHRHPVTKCHTDVTVMSQNVTKHVTTSTPEMSHDVTPNVTPMSQVLADIAVLRGMVKLLTTRIDAMEAWGEALEARWPRLAAPSVSQVAASGPQPRILYPQARAPRAWPGTWRVVPPGARPGDTFTTSKGQSLTVPEMDAGGQPIPE